MGACVPLHRGAGRCDGRGKTNVAIYFSDIFLYIFQVAVVCCCLVQQKNYIRSITFLFVRKLYMMQGAAAVVSIKLQYVAWVSQKDAHSSFPHWRAKRWKKKMYSPTWKRRFENDVLNI